MGEIHQVNVKLSEEEYDLLERLRQRLEQQSKIPGTKISQRQTILAALHALEASYDRLERDRARPR